MAESGGDSGDGDIPFSWNEVDDGISERYHFMAAGDVDLETYGGTIPDPLYYCDSSIGGASSIEENDDQAKCGDGSPVKETTKNVPMGLKKKGKVNGTLPPAKASTNRGMKRNKKRNGFPKRPLSGYNLYFQEIRPTVQATAQEQGENLGFRGLAKIIGSRWKALPPEQKRKYEELAETDKERYQRERKEFNEKQKAENEKIAESMHSSSAQSSGRSPEFSTAKPAFLFQPLSQNLSQGPIRVAPAALRQEPHSRQHPRPAVASTASPESGHASTHSPYASSVVFPQIPQGSVQPQFSFGINAQQGCLLTDGTVAAALAASASTAGHIHPYVAFPTAPAGSEHLQSQRTIQLPPGMEVSFGGQNGEARRYIVKFERYVVSTETAKRYFDYFMETPPPNHMSDSLTPSVGNPIAAVPALGPSDQQFLYSSIGQSDSAQGPLQPQHLVGANNARGARSTAPFPSPPPIPSGNEQTDHESNGPMLLPPGMEIVLSDRSGKENKYTVKFDCKQISMETAQSYMDLYGASAAERINGPSNFAGSIPDPRQWI